MLESLAVIVSTSLPLAYGMVMCASERDTARGKKKSERSKKGGKSGRSRSKKSTRSRGRSKSRKSKSSKSRKSSKSKKSRKSSKSSRSKKSSRSTRTAKQKSAKLAKDAERKLEKSAKCSTSNNSCKKAPTEEKSAPAPAPNVACNNNNNASSRECGKKSNIAEELRSIKHLKNMSVVPSRLPFASQGGINSIDIKNNSNERKAYKVKCSDNLLYRVNPVFGFAEPNSTTRVDVLRANGEEKMDKLVVITATVNNEKDARSVFTRDGLEHEMMVVPLTVN